jgi:hypothetical protein
MASGIEGPFGLIALEVRRIEEGLPNAYGARRHCILHQFELTGERVNDCWLLSLAAMGVISWKTSSSLE